MATGVEVAPGRHPGRSRSDTHLELDRKKALWHKGLPICPICPIDFGLICSGWRENFFYPPIPDGAPSHY
jgi:hypothetical protein